MFASQADLSLSPLRLELYFAVACAVLQRQEEWGVVNKDTW